MKKQLVGHDDWILKDTKVVRLPRGETFVSFMKIKRRLYVLSNKAIYKLTTKGANERV